MLRRVRRTCALGVLLLVLCLPGVAYAVNYYLPWTQGKAFQCTQGNNMAPSHLDEWNKYAWDFGLGFGEPVRASAAGTVIGLNESAIDFPSNPNISTPVNYVLIAHSDGTRTGYYHLKQNSIPSDVVLNGTVRSGQIIGGAGCSGYSFGTHLHFSRSNASGYSMALTFADVGVPIAGRSYTSGNVEQGVVPRYNPVAPGDAGFARYGSAAGWHNIGGGLYGTGIYTWNGGSTRDNYARWTFDLSKIAGTRKYKAEAYVTSTHAGTLKADYHINTSAGVTHAVVNQNALSNQWANLGSFNLASGSAWVELDDVTGETPLSKEIAFDAIRLTPYYVLKYTAGTGGTISGTATQSILSGGSGTAVTAVASSGYHFTKWSDGVTTAVRTDKTVKADKSVSAVFASNEVPFARIAGSDRYATAIKTSQKVFSAGSCNAVVIATGLNYPDALSAAGLAGAANAPILLVSGDTLRSDVKTEIQRVTQGKTSFKVYIMGSTAAVSAKLEASIKNGLTGESVERFSGSDRYATSRLVAAKVKALAGTSFGTKAILVSGSEFADGLIVGPAAFRSKTPVLLTGTTSSSGLVSTLKSLGTKELVVLGTTSRIPTSLESSLKTAIPGLSTRRVSSASDKYDRSAAAAEYFATPANGFGLGWSSIGVATGEVFADGLGASCVEGKKATSLLLTRPTSLPTAVSARLAAHKSAIGGVRIYGSTTAVSAEVETGIKNLLK